MMGYVVGTRMGCKVQAVAVNIATLRGCSFEVARNAKINTRVIAMSISMYLLD